MGFIEKNAVRKLVTWQVWLNDPNGPTKRFRRDDGLVSAELLGFVVIGLVFLLVVVGLQGNAATALGNKIQAAIGNLP